MGECTHTLTSLLADTGGPGAFGALEIDIVPVVLAGPPNELPVEFNADALAPLELCAKSVFFLLIMTIMN